MEVIKNYTDVEQSKKLSEFLSIESADMCYIKHTSSDNPNWEFNEDFPPIILGNMSINEITVETLPCWSLTALLNIIPKDKSIECSISFGYYNGEGEYIEKWLCAFEKEGETTDDYIIETFDGDNPVDACVAMILKLKEMNLL